MRRALACRPWSRTLETIDEIRADYEARYGEARTELIEAGRVRDYLLALDDRGALLAASNDSQARLRPGSEPGPGSGLRAALANLQPGALVPALFLLTLGRTRRPQPARGSAVNAGDEFEFFEPARIGDAITIQRRLIDVVEKQGRNGIMYLARAEATFRNQHGTLVARSRQDTLRWGW